MTRIVVGLLETLHSEVYAADRREVARGANVDFHSFDTEVREFDRLYRSRALAGLQRTEVAANISFEDFVAMERLVERHQVFPLSTEDKRGEILGAISFWHGKLEQAQVAAVFFATSSPHWPFNYSAYAAAQILGIPVFSASSEFITRRIHLYRGLKDMVIPRDPGHASDRIHEFFESAAKKVENPAYINAYFRTGNSYARFFWQLAKNIRKALLRTSTDDVWSLFDVRQGRFHKMRYAMFSLRKGLRSLGAVLRLRKAYRRNVTPLGEVPDNAIIFYASYQPEATTCPDAQLFHDFRLALRALVDQGYKVYYREHPTVFLFTIGSLLNFVGVYRDEHFYDSLRSMGVELLDLGVSHDFLMTRFKSFATCTGTVALQAAAQGKRVIVFGKPWFATPPGVHSCYAGGLPSPDSVRPTPNVPELTQYFAQTFGAGFDNVYGLQGYDPVASPSEYKAFLFHLVEAVLATSSPPADAAASARVPEAAHL